MPFQRGVADRILRAANHSESECCTVPQFRAQGPNGQVAVAKGSYHDQRSR